ncbi:hypothetical protein B0H13DRAFT_2577491 [Mycena leptocephala]|nr:hypothetical protein B0H13DRAFT_2577491 [Mycena leptocephala]
MPSRTKNTKAKEMFKSYDVAEVPDIMPFPELGGVATTKGEETAVPKLNEHQQSWILDIGVRSTDLLSLKGKAAKTFYEKVKTDVFDAKAFQHMLQPTDWVEEARLPALVAAWKEKKPSKKKNNSAADDDDASDEEEDEGGQGGLLRGYTKAGWRQVLQKVISNKRTAENNKRKTKNDDTSPIAETPALSKLLGLVASSSRDKFRQDRYDNILEYSKTLTDAINAGSKFRKAEGLMWAEEDQASWEAAAASEEDVDWEERQRLVASGFKNMVDSLHVSGKFRPFVVTMLMGWVDPEGQVHLEWWSRVEAVPKDICVRQTFEKQTPQLVKDSLNTMYAWAEKPLKDYVATLEDSTNAAPQVFALSAEGLDDVSPKALAQTVTNFLVDSYQAAFGTRDIPWAAVASTPKEYYDADITFTSTGLVQLTVAQWCRRGRMMKRRIVHEDARCADEAKAEAARLAGEAARVADEAKAEVACLADEAKVEEARLADEAKAEAARLADEAKAEDARLADEAKAEAARLADEAKAEVARLAEDMNIVPPPPPPSPPPRKGTGGRKQKAESQLVLEDDAPESAGPARRTTRTRLTPQEAALEHQKKLAAEVTVNGAKPSFEYVWVPRSPAKPKRNSTSRVSTLHAETKSAAAKAKAAAKEAVALEKPKAEYEKEVGHLTKLAAQKRDDTIEKAGEELKKAVTTASIIRCKEEASAQSAGAKADEKAAKACLSAEKDAWKECQAVEKEAHAAFAKAAKLATIEREKAEKAVEAARKAAIKAILAKRDRAFKEAEREKVISCGGTESNWGDCRDVGTEWLMMWSVDDGARGGRQVQTAERAAEHDEAAANNLKAGEAAEAALPPTLLEWIGSFIWGAKSLAPEVEGAK